ncbi:MULTISPECIES: 2-amino-4-hydroxy-6-hydroxymethyldihydropteridine diphosphokinase [Corynebacterium]|uniref:2-amino-4-hydroxy-6-hydroxymethyldihydropteridine diphosphokinase n=1 Tax=Corynebacterium hadale TaxID=2026255 RepID=A0A269PFD5_9CORY|nr:2-amino-4-hydroxy-6-hydroxymethyldihydropteridine diphosphokinase [Corynebacterium hadale]MCG7254761.1 2-amino-4-hydroxy-6-hydroxymethyldihydropteridine diphosphokinase [Corynebacterium hadale]MCG7257100.1 2-amino-4-hydroxy-6-hydroxymethyldihydropteridine diphosphokinase [Corynebacterium hadale]MCG7265641.1 2-amino-4-hydroxy-6-hydroxymethyldihydropteridine diphosphokinase [Corynebacterium hadale]PAJ70808.1 2-amino-4-hydroxy-6-hydroxymethyldihydropteridine diphosphokinase [Corynebacterium had
MRAVISAGSNMEDSRAHLASVVRHFAGSLVAASSLYATAPWGKTDQPDFLNQSMLIDAPLTPTQLLRECQALEEAANRVRVERWGPRTLDVDIVDIAGYTSNDPELTVPHPRAHLRAFVLAPWLEIDPDATLGGERVADLLARLDPAERDGVRRLEG